MDRVLNFINILLLCIVGMLLLIGVMVLVQGSKVDLGKIADWAAVLSASATAGTFGVAFAAYKKAPDWLGQKKHEDAYIIAKNLFINDFFELKRTVIQSITVAETLSTDMDIISDDIDDVLTMENCNSNLNIFQNAGVTPASMLTNLEKLKILGWEFTIESDTKFASLNSSFSELRKKHSLLWVSLKLMIGKERRKTDEEIQEFITKNFEQLKIAKAEFEEDYNEFFKHDFENYFNIAKTKKN
ncbi:hypothetical protein [Enterobacter ludwigii]